MLMIDPRRVAKPIVKNSWYDCTAKTMPIKVPVIATTGTLMTPTL
jgi:hypothetical protein